MIAKIAVLDYGIGNLRSAEKALQHVGAAARLVTDPADVEAADAVVLPGVGAFGACARALGESGLEPAARAALEAGVPFFGVCIGFQLLYAGSEENPGVAGLGVFPGTVALLPAGEKHPQMQWNQLDAVPWPGRRRQWRRAGGSPAWSGGEALGLLRALLCAAHRPRDGGGLRLRRPGGRGGGPGQRVGRAVPPGEVRTERAGHVGQLRRPGGVIGRV